MRLENISISNIRRRKTKMAFVAMGLSVAVATVVLLTTITNATRADIDRKLDEFGANIVIFPKSDELTLSYGGITVQGASYDVKDLSQADVALIKTIKDKDSISAIAPKVVGSALIENREALLVGVNFTDELKIKKWWAIDGQAPSANSQALLGSQSSVVFGKHVGDTIRIKGEDYKITGILAETGEQDDSLIFINLAAAQKVLDKPGRISLIEVAALCSTCPIEEIDRQISAKLPHAKVSTIKQSVEAKMTSVDQLSRFSSVVSVVLILIGALLVLITMMASVNERTREIGIYRAIGFRRFHIIRIILLESVIIGLAGGFIGYGLGLAGAFLVIGQIAGPSVSISINIVLFVEAIVLSILIGVIGSIYPAIRASNLDPAGALRTL